MQQTEHLNWAHPLVRDWFIKRFQTPTEPQIAGWPRILANEDTLISAPTGSGKTLAAFLACINQLVCKAADGSLKDATEVVYISPLKALSNDVQKNLEQPLREIQELAKERGIELPEIRAQVRTGDTLAPERQAMLRKPPHILVTTPESLYILITAQKSSENLKTVETIIIDEIHAVADDKRGAHLALSVERLAAKTYRKPVRIGLSATVKPIEAVAQFLVGTQKDQPHIVNVGHKRTLDLSVEVPEIPLGAVATHEMWENIYDQLTALVNEHRSTLIFANTRKLAERIAHQLSQRIGEESVTAHHGSLSRKLRLNAEKRLKAGELKALVATASLELGIDIGAIDLVCQIGSPRSIAVALQRVGRAGHWRGAIPKGRIFATTRDELLEAAALVHAIGKSDLDRLMIPDTPLDVLAQQIVATCADSEYGEDELYSLVTAAYPYRDLSSTEFESVIQMLTEGFGGDKVRRGAYLHRDLVNKKVKGKRGSRLFAITNGGAIPDNTLYSVVLEPEGTLVGTVDEDFAVEANRGDIMLLGTNSWQIRRVESMSGRVLVEDAHGAPPTIPFWRGEAPARTIELSKHLATVRERIDDETRELQPADSANTQQSAANRKIAAVNCPPHLLEWLREECGLSDYAAEQSIQYVLEGRSVLGAVPTLDTVIAERFFDESGGMQLVIHAPFGGRINKAWGLALRKKFCRGFNFELQAAATENGINISLTEQHSFPLADVFSFLRPETLQETLEQAVVQSPIFATRWRWDANRALALLRFQGGKKVPPQIQRMRAEDLLASLFPDAAACQDNITEDLKIPDHPLINEVMKDALTEAMDIEGLKNLLYALEEGKVRAIAIDTPVPSAFAHEILNSNPYAYLDDAPLEERRSRAVEMRRVLPPEVLQQVGMLDPEAIAQVREEAWPDIRDADELHDVLLTMVTYPEDAAPPAVADPSSKWSSFFGELIAANRATFATNADGRRFWVIAERANSFKLLFPDAKLDKELANVETETTQELAMLNLISGWLQHLGPTDTHFIQKTLGLSQTDTEYGLIRLESTGAIMRGKFSQDLDSELQWCDRRLLARIHRLTVGKLRKAVEPVTAAQFVRWLSQWQHVVPGSQLVGERGLLEVIAQMQGFEVPASAWETYIFSRRVREYDPEELDRLCLTGQVGWGRLSPHPALEDSTNGSESTVSRKRTGSRAGTDHGAKSASRRVTPTSAAPITFYVRDESDWMTLLAGRKIPVDTLSYGARTVYAYLEKRGASFFTDIVKGAALLKTEVETALWELVTAGLVTADGFDSLRSLIDPKRRSGHGTARFSRPRHSSGRWSIVHLEEPQDRLAAVESVCWMLLKRYGVVFRELLARETLVPRWRELLYVFRRLEDRAEVRGGRFISGLTGEQFALPSAVDSLRAMRNKQPSNLTLTVSAADPLNLVGIVVPGEKIPGVASRSVALRDGLVYDPENQRSIDRLLKIK